MPSLMLPKVLIGLTTVCAAAFGKRSRLFSYFGYIVVSLFSASFTPYGLGYSSPNLGYGGGLSFTANLKPYDLRNPIDYAYGVAFGYGLDAAGRQLSDTISITGAGGNGIGSGTGFGGASNGLGYGGGNVNSLVAGNPGYSQSFTNNVAFSGQQGNGHGFGNAVGQVGQRRF